MPNVSYTVDENKIYYNPLILQPNDEIWYTSTDGKIVEPYSGATTPFIDATENNIPIVSNTYENGKGIIKLEKDCYRIGLNAFYDKPLLNIILPNTIDTIYASSFLACTSLVNFVIPKSTTKIANYAFTNCTSLLEITIPNLVSSIGASAFQGCSNLSSITVLPETPPTLGLHAFDSIASNAVIYVDNSDYFLANNWSNYNSKMKIIS